jgi:hypothetical protein
MKKWIAASERGLGKRLHHTRVDFKIVINLSPRLRSLIAQTLSEYP